MGATDEVGFRVPAAPAAAAADVAGEKVMEKFGFIVCDIEVLRIPASVSLTAPAAIAAPDIQLRSISGGRDFRWWWPPLAAEVIVDDKAFDTAAAAAAAVLGAAMRTVRSSTVGVDVWLSFVVAIT